MYREDRPRDGRAVRAASVEHRRVVDDDVVTGARERRRDAPSHVAVTDHAHLQVPPPTDDAVSPQEAPWQHLGERSKE